MTNTDQLLTRRVEKILPSRDALQKLLDSGKKIRLYQGYDPTASRLHLGHTIGMRKLMDFANAGHEVIFLFGTGTVLVGDPSERDTGRKLITQEEIDNNIKDWQKQVEPVVNFSQVTIKQNGDWLTQLTLKNIINIASNISAVQLFKRDSFQRRLDQGDTVWYHETLYPLLQGYDSVVMDVDLEIGGTDQEFNMLVGRELQRKMNDREKFVLTVPMITGTDGGQMSKTSGNCIWLDDIATDMYGKTMSIPDDQIKPYWELLTDLPTNNLDDKISSDPMATKKDLALDITRQFHGEDAARQAADHFQSTIQSGHTPTELPELEISKGNHTYWNIITQANHKLNLGYSNSQLKRLAEQGAVYRDSDKVTDPQQSYGFSGGETFKIGKRAYFKTKC